jgi:hypothetical protein
MSYKILILGASYGSLLGTKCLMAGHDVTLVCRAATAKLINDEGTDVRIRLKGEDDHRSILSKDLPGKLNALTPENVDVADYDLVGLAMQEPQYSHDALARLLEKIAKAGLPCLSIMNMPPLPYLKRLPGLDTAGIERAFFSPRIWDAFKPGNMTLCSPDPQAFRPPEEGANVLHVGLPTNFKAAKFESAAHNEMLETLERDIQEVRLDGKDVPVKLRVHDSLFVPLAKWSMLLTGNYRCITKDQPIAIRDAVHGDIDHAREVYGFVDELVQRLGAQPDELVPFEKYARAAEGLLKPSSAARAIDGGTDVIERVDRIVQLVARSLGMQHPTVDVTVAIVDAQLERNRQSAAA